MRYKVVRGTLDAAGVNGREQGPLAVRREEEVVDAPSRRSPDPAGRAGPGPPQSRIVQQVINKVMLDGKKSTAENDRLRRARDPRRAVRAPTRVEVARSRRSRSLTPSLEVRSRRVGGATYQVPVEVPARRARTLAVRWLVEFARQRREKTMAQRLAVELLEARRPAAQRLQAQGRHLPHGAGKSLLPRALTVIPDAGCRNSHSSGHHDHRPLVLASPMAVLSVSARSLRTARQRPADHD